MRLGHRLAAGLVLVLSSSMVLTPAPPAGAAGAAGGTGAPTTSLTLSAEATFAGRDTAVRVDLQDPTGAPVAGAPVVVERQRADEWAPVATVTTDETGHASARVTLSRLPADNVVRASYAGDGTVPPATARVRLELLRRASTLSVGGPRSVVDERSVKVTVSWQTRNGEHVSGPVRLYRSLGGGRWRKVTTLTTGQGGFASVTVKPRSDSRWRATARRLSWVAGARSGVHRVDNLPPGEPVQLPGAAPSPRRRLPAQGHAVGDGAHLVVSRIPDGIWSQMTGRTWHAGCPVGRAGLRLVRINYWDYRGYRRRGELVAAAGAAGAMGAALAEMYQRELPIRAMYRVDRFGWSARSGGGDDYASMAAGNTSAFNCRDVTGRPGVRSPHSYGRALDLNTWENPYRSARGLVPNTWWQSHSHPRVAWRSRSHVVVALMARHGLRWTYGLGDTQHFDYVGSSARAAVRPRACDRFCD